MEGGTMVRQLKEKPMEGTLEFEALQRALRDPWPDDDPAEPVRGQRKAVYGWRNEVTAERVRRFFRQGARKPAPGAQPTNC
jgi:hypothetical protein